jgi:Tol biopolymer transport system component
MKRILITLFILSFVQISFAQFGQNKVQYKNFTWYYIQTTHFDIYFSQEGTTLAEFASKAAEDALKSIQTSFNYRINNRITLIVYNSTNDFQETNVTDVYLTEGIEGFTELFKNRVVVQFTGSYKKFRHLIHHELVHAVMNDLFYGGSLQNIISSNITVNIPLWFSEGMAEYQALGWDYDTDMFIRDAALNEYLPDIQRLGGYFAYRGGQSVFYYISTKYGKQKIGELITKVKATGSAEEGIKASLGLTLEELNERWKKDIKKRFWPDIAIRKDPEEFAKRLTDPKKNDGFYNTSPALSPQGDKIAFLSNRDYYFDVYLMDAIDGRIIKRLVRGSRSADFEELNVLTPGISWNPEGTKIALAAKRKGYDVIYIIDVESEDSEILPFRMDGIQSVAWSSDGSKIAFVGHNPHQSDIYLYEFSNNTVINLTNDIFSDIDPAWSHDDKIIFFASDRNDNLNAYALPDSFSISAHNYGQNDIYSINLETRVIERITDLPYSDETSPVTDADGRELIFVSDLNGINNIYKLSLIADTAEVVPITNSVSGLYQLSASRDAKKLLFSTLNQASFNLFQMNNPFDPKTDGEELKPTLFKEANDRYRIKSEEEIIVFEENEVPSPSDTLIQIFTGNYIDTTGVYGDSIRIDFNNYVFGKDIKIADDTSYRAKFNLSDNLDREGNYRVNRYKINFSPDLIYANAGYSTLYGLLGTTVLSFSDVLGNHRLIGVTSLQIDLKNSDYGLAYYYLPERINFGVEAFHTARFVFFSRGPEINLFRFRNFGGVVSASYPLSRFNRFDAGLSYLNVSSENLDNPTEISEKTSYLIPAVSYIHDNALWGYTSPVDGSRYRLDLFGNPGISGKKLSFYSVMGDYRTYLRFWTDYSFAFRLSGGFSGGANPQRFFIGGIENWINRRFATGDIPINSAADFAFLTPAMPLRGYDYAEQIGTRYGLMNLELRFPLIRYLVTGALPVLFSNILGTAFIDVGSAWNSEKDLRFFERTAEGTLVSRDLLMGTGVGARIFFLYFLLRFDVAWAYDMDAFSRPKFYFSLGLDF